MFESGEEVTIGNAEYQGPDKGPQKLLSFRYEAKPVRSGANPEMQQGAGCETREDEGFGVLGNIVALKALVEQCFDLAHTRTGVGLALSYRPGRQLSNESVPLVLRRA